MGNKRRKWSVGIFQRGNKLWMTIYDPLLGKGVNKPTGQPATPEGNRLAKTIRAEAIYNLSHRSLIDITKPVDSSILLSQALEQYKRHKILAPKTIKACETAVSLLIEACGDKSIGAYTKSDNLPLKTIFDEYEYSENSMAIYSRTLRGIFNLYVNLEVIPKNPIARIVAPKKKPVAIPDNDLEFILTELKSRSKNLYDLIYFLSISGFRIGEAISPRWENIDFNENIIRFRNQKAKREDTFPLLKVILEHFKNMGIQKFGNVFAYRSTSVAVYYRIQKKAWGEPRYNVHQLRKTFISRMAGLKMSPLDVQKLARHFSITTTQEYYIEDQTERIRKDVDKVFKNPVVGKDKEKKTA